MRTVRYVGSADRYRLTQDGVDIEAGAAETVDDDLAEYLLDRDDFEEVDEASEDVDEEEENSTPDTQPPINPADYTVGELESAVDDGDYSDDELEAIRAAEAAGKDRKGVRGAIDTRLED